MAYFSQNDIRRQEIVPGWVESTWGNVMLIDHANVEITVDIAEGCAKRIRDWLDTQSAAYLAVITSGPPPPPVTRTIMQEAVMDRPEVRSVVFLIEIDGLIGAALRSIATGMTLLSRNSYDTKFTKDREDLAALLARLAQHDPHAMSELIGPTRSAA